MSSHRFAPENQCVPVSDVADGMDGNRLINVAVQKSDYRHLASDINGDEDKKTARVHYTVVWIKSRTQSSGALESYNSLGHFIIPHYLQSIK